MRFEFDFYEKDDCLTGLSMEIDCNDYVDITSLYGYGDYSGIEKNIKTLKDLEKFITSKMDEVEERTEKGKYTRKEVLEELLEFVLTTQIANKVIEAVITQKTNPKVA